MNNKIELAQNKFVESLGRMSDAFGLNSFVTKLYALLYLNNKPLSLDEITEALGVSKGNVSVNIRILENWGAVRKVWVKGSRKDFYEAEPDIKKVFLDKLKSAVEKRLDEFKHMMDEFDSLISSVDSSELTPEESELLERYKERLKNIEEFRGFASNMLALTKNLF